MQKLLPDITQQSRALADAQRRLHGQIESDWKVRIDDNTKRAGAEQAKAFAEGIAAGLQKRLGDLAANVEALAQRFIWAMTLRWTPPIVFGIALGAWALVPSVEGLSTPYVRAAMNHLAVCEVGKERRVCAEIDPSLSTVRSANGEVLAVVKGL